ncbi:MAG: hypothetical protein ABJ004_08515 [Cyclobacteriaceae bacterium]
MKPSLLPYLVLIVTLLSSCSEDKEKPSVANYDGEALMFSDCLQQDWADHTGTHYNMDFTFVGEKTVFLRHENIVGEEYFTFSEEFDFYIFMELFTAGTKEFTGGVYHSIGENSFDEVEDENVFRTFWFGPEPGAIIPAESGQVVVKIGKSGNYAISFDITLQDGNELTGSYIGAPQYVVGRR